MNDDFSVIMKTSNIKILNVINANITLKVVENSDNNKPHTPTKLIIYYLYFIFTSLTKNIVQANRNENINDDISMNLKYLLKL